MKKEKKNSPQNDCFQMQSPLDLKCSVKSLHVTVTLILGKTSIIIDILQIREAFPSHTWLFKIQLTSGLELSVTEHAVFKVPFQCRSAHMWPTLMQKGSIACHLSVDYAYSCQVLSTLRLKAISNAVFASKYIEVFWRYNISQSNIIVPAHALMNTV